MPEINIFDEARKQISPLQDDSLLYIDETAERILHFFFKLRRRSDFGDIRETYRQLGTGEEKVRNLTNFDWYNFTKLQMYILHYSLKYIPRVQLNILSILKKLPEVKYRTIFVYDIGIGPGTTAIAFLTLFEKLLQFHNVLNSNDKSNIFSIKRIHIIYIDKNLLALDRCESILDHMIKFRKTVLSIPVTYEKKHLDVDELDISLWFSTLNITNNSDIHLFCSFNTLQEIDLQTFCDLKANIQQSANKYTHLILGEYLSRHPLRCVLKSDVKSLIDRSDPQSLYNNYNSGLPENILFDWRWQTWTRKVDG